MLMPTATLLYRQKMSGFPVCVKRGMKTTLCSRHLAQPLCCAHEGEVAGVRVNEPVSFMNDTTKIGGEKMLRLHEPLPIYLPVESSVDGLDFYCLPLCQLQLITIPAWCSNESLKSVKAVKLRRRHGQAPVEAFLWRTTPGCPDEDLGSHGDSSSLDEWPP